MNKETKVLISRIIISLLLFISAFMVLQNLIKIILFIISYIIIGFDIIKEAIENIFHGEFFDENFLMTVATFGAFAIGEYPEAVMVMWLYQIGECFQDHAAEKSRNSITELMNIRPDFANIEKDGEIIQVDPKDLKIDDVIIVKPGEKVPLDGTIINGESALDTSALTGESLPRKVTIGMDVFSGCINTSGLLTIKVTKVYSESTVSKILELVENASSKKAKAENFITKFAKIYTPVVVILALCLAFIPPLIIPNANLFDYISRACSFLVISCPCALVISVPLGFFAGIGGASKNGILIKGGNYLETLSHTKTVVLDKTGTLTKGTFKVTKINAINISEEKLIEYSALAELTSTHPIGDSIKKAYGKDLDINRVKDVKEISGKGIYAKVDDNEILIGNAKLLKSNNISFNEEKIPGTITYVALNNNYAGYIIISDEIKDEAKDAIKNLKKENQVVMLTGDNKEVALDVAKKLEIDTVYAELLPSDKVQEVEDILKNSNGSTIFVGDGINDAPVLTRADIGIAMGGLGSDAAVEAADVVIMDDDISKIDTAIKLSKRTLNIVRLNIAFAIIVKIVVLVLSACGLADMWLAVLADVGVSLLSILNSMRALKKI